jgi:hypothetical protein
MSFIPDQRTQWYEVLTHPGGSVGWWTLLPVVCGAEVSYQLARECRLTPAVRPL